MKTLLNHPYPNVSLSHFKKVAHTSRTVVLFKTHKYAIPFHLSSTYKLYFSCVSNGFSFPEIFQILFRAENVPTIKCYFYIQTHGRHNNNNRKVWSRGMRGDIYRFTYLSYTFMSSNFKCLLGLTQLVR